MKGFNRADSERISVLLRPELTLALDMLAEQSGIPRIYFASDLVEQQIVERFEHCFGITLGVFLKDPRNQRLLALARARGFEAGRSARELSHPQPTAHKTGSRAAALERRKVS